MSLASLIANSARPLSWTKPKEWWNPDSGRTVYEYSDGSRVETYAEMLWVVEPEVAHV